MPHAASLMWLLLRCFPPAGLQPAVSQEEMMVSKNVVETCP